MRAGDDRCLAHAGDAAGGGNGGGGNAEEGHIDRMGKAAVIPCAHYRLPGGRYEIEFGPALEDFPCGDDEQDTARINSTIEGYVRKCPEQYLWVHKRFKHQPAGQPRPY